MKHRFTSQRPNADLPELLAIFQARQPEGERRGGWYSIENVSQTEAEIFLYDEIGMWGVSAGDFISDLRAVKASTITLRINSPGGDVFDGVAIYNAVKRHPATVDVFVDGVAASAASFIAMAGDTVTMSQHSQMMIHEASGLVIGPTDDMRKMADILDKSSDNIAGIYAERAGGTVPEWRERMRDETWLSDREAVDLGLADSIDGEEVENRLPAGIPAAWDAERMGIVTDGLAQSFNDVTRLIAEESAPEAPDFKKLLKDISERNAEEIFA